MVQGHGRARTIVLIAFLACALALIPACTKDTDPIERPAIREFRAFDLVTAVAKADGDHGHVLLCKQAPTDRRTSDIRWIGTDGSLQGGIPLGMLPRRIENLDFLEEELLFTDLSMQADGDLILAGTAVQTALDARLYMVLYRMTRAGVLIGAPIRRYITDQAVTITVPPTEPLADPDGLPRQRALVAVLPTGVAVAARWGTATAAGVRAWWFPSGDQGGAVATVDLALDRPDDRMILFAGDPVSSRVVLVLDRGTSGGHHHTRVVGFQLSDGVWSSPEEIELPWSDMEPQQLAFVDGTFLLVGYKPAGDVVRPFISRFVSVADAANGTREVQDPASAGRPLTAYCARIENGTVLLAMQDHEPSAAAPWFTADLSSDLVLARVDADGVVIERRVLVPGQGLRAIDLTGGDGGTRIIGSMHPYLNAGYEHTFFLVPDQ